MRYFIVFLAVLVLAPLSHSTTWYVPDHFSTIQGAINACVDGDTVIARPGTYVENIDFIGKAITVMSEMGPEVTVIDGGSPVNPNYGSAVLFQNGEGLDSVIEGFTLTKGTGTYYSTWSIFCGGGVFADHTTCPTIRNNIVCGNTVAAGETGGICSFAGVITENTVFDNTSFYAGAGVSAGGTDQTVTITNNKIFRNTCTGWCGGGLIVGGAGLLVTQGVVSGNEIYENTTLRGGGGLAFENCEVLVENNLIRDNVAEAAYTNYGGGGILCIGGGDVTIQNNCIINNLTKADGGGGIYCRNASPTLLNNFIGNNKANRGGGFDCYNTCNPVIGNCTFWGNSANKGGALSCRRDSVMEITDSIFWENTADSGKEIYLGAPSYPSTLTISYSDVKGGQASVENNGAVLIWGAGMIDADPLYAAGPCGFHYLSQMASGQPADSPCVDTGGDLASNLGMDVYWTRTDEVADSGSVDMGYHYGSFLFPSLQADVFMIPESTGGQADFLLMAGSDNANRDYLLLGSVSGTDVGIPLPGGKAALPLNYDFFTNVTILYSNTLLFMDFMGTLDAMGKGTAQMNLGPVPGAAGITMYFAYALDKPWNFASSHAAVRMVQ